MIFAKIIKGAKPGAEPKRRGPDADVLSIVSVGNWEAADAGSVQCHDRSSVAKIRPGSRKSVRPFKGIICGDISEFESYMPSQAVRSPRVKK